MAACQCDCPTPIIAVSGLTVDVLESIWTIISKQQFCGDILVIWIISAFWNILSDMVLFTAIYRVREKIPSVIK